MKFRNALIAGLLALMLAAQSASAATNFLWGNIGTIDALLTTELNALATGSGTVYGPEINNVNGAQRCQIWLHLASNSSAFTTSSYVSVYFVSSTTPNASSGTYPTYTSGTTPVYSGNGFAANIPINPKTQSANVVDETQQSVVLPAGFFKTILISSAGVALPATGNTLGCYPTPTQY